MQGTEIEEKGSVLTYMTKSEIEEQRSSLLIMTQRLLTDFFTIILPIHDSAGTSYPPPGKPSDP